MFVVYGVKVCVLIKCMWLNSLKLNLYPHHQSDFFFMAVSKCPPVYLFTIVSVLVNTFGSTQSTAYALKTSMHEL